MTDRSICRFRRPLFDVMSTDSEIEIRQVFEMDDFGAELTPELREQEERLWAQAAENAKR